jgi:hypothetical protein
MSSSRRNWHLGDCVEARGKFSGDFYVALQGKACSKWQCGEVQGNICGSWFSQKEGVDYEETFSLVAKYSIRAVLSIASEMGWSIHQMDVKTTFLNGFIEKEVYIEQPQEFEVHDKETHVCKMKKAMYGLKQAPNVDILM